MDRYRVCGCGRVVSLRDWERVRDKEVVRDMKWGYIEVRCRAVSGENIVKVVSSFVSIEGEGLSERAKEESKSSRSDDFSVWMLKSPRRTSGGPFSGMFDRRMSNSSKKSPKGPGGR